MEIIVPIRQVPDVALNIRVNEGKVVEDGVSFVISSWDETAIEGALQMTEELGGEVTLLGIGTERVSEALRKGLAMGAHKAIHVLYEEGQTDSFGYAKIMAKVMEGRTYDLILTGKQAQDTDAGLTASMLAEFLDLPQVTNIIRFSDLAVDGMTLYRKGDHGTEVIGIKLPALVTVNDPLTLHVMANAGFDYLLVDTQHSVIGTDTLFSIIKGLNPTQSEVIVRVIWNDRALINQAFDFGADGVIDRFSQIKPKVVCDIIQILLHWSHKIL